MPSEILHRHFQKIAELYGHITPGNNLTPPENRPDNEASLLSEIASARQLLRERIDSLGRPRPIRVATGEPKGAWAHIYYVSFHDPANSHGPTEGFYPVFLTSVDQRQCWLALAVAAASVGISGRGGWSNRRGTQLRNRADFLGRNLPESDGWQKGSITLGPNGSSLHSERGSNRPAGRAYECCTIISKVFDPHNPPDNLREWLLAAFGFYDSVFQEESTYIQTSIPRTTPAEAHEQANAALTGAAAEEYFMNWAPTAHPEWGPPVNRTNRVGLGFDIEFPDCGLKVEVKGCRRGIEDIRLTEREWAVAESSGPDYVLAIVSNLDVEGSEEVSLIRDPHSELSNHASRQIQLQVNYTVPHGVLRQHIAHDQDWFQQSHSGDTVNRAPDA